MRTRIKHAIMLIIRLAFFLAVFCMTVVGTKDDEPVLGEPLSAEAAEYMKQYENEDGTSKDMNVFQSIGIVIKATKMEISAKGIGHYMNFNFVKAFWDIAMPVGFIFFLWSDMRFSFKMGQAIAGRYPITTVVTKVFINGVYSHSYEEFDAFNSPFFISIICFFISWALLTFLLPIRILINIIMDIVAIIGGSEEMGNFSVTGNIVASIGLYMAFLSFVMLKGYGNTTGWIYLGVGAALFIGGAIVDRLEIF